MKYGKFINEALDVKEVENGVEVGGSLTQQQIVDKGYKPLCEVEGPDDVAECTYKEYEECIVQEWVIDSEVEE